MEGSHGGSSSPAPFLAKTYDMLEDPSTNSTVSWSPSGNSFIVWNPLDFARDLLPAYFKHNNFSSFIRQLNTYGFRKIDPERWEFANDEFTRGQRHILKNIHRRKPIHSHSIPPLGGNVSIPLSESERQLLKEEIETLKHDKDTLILELQKHTQHQQDMDQQMLALEERLQGMVLRQKNLASFVDHVIQRPGFLSSLVQQSDLHSKKRRLPNHDDFHKYASIQDDKNLTLQGVSGEKFDISSMPLLLDIEPFEKMESSLNSLENFFHEVGQASDEDTFFDEPQHCLNSTVASTEMHSSSGETHVNMHSPSPDSGPSSTGPEVILLYPDLEDSPNRGQSTIIPLVDAQSLQTGMRRKVSVIDVNSEPTVHSRKQGTETLATTMPTGVNDIFWEQFLTESPGYCIAQEAQSERRDPDSRRAEAVITEQGSAWWSRKSVDHLTEKMGHLTSAERT